MDIQEPPAIYQPYDGPLCVIRRAPMQVRTICYGLGLYAVGIIGCMVWTQGCCLIVIPKNDDGSVRRHEEAHCAGWRH